MSDQGYSGSAVVGQWIYSGGTITLTGNQRSMSYSPSIDLIDVTAGSDPSRKRIPAVKDFSASYQAILGVGGTAIEDALVEGTGGTLIVAPEGTATGKRKLILPSISGGAQVSLPYADAVEISCEFSGNGAATRTTY